MIALVFVFIGLAALAKGKLRVTAHRELSAWRARAIGLGFLGVAYFLESVGSISDQQLAGLIAEDAARKGYASSFLTDTTDLWLLLIPLAVVAGVALTACAFLLARDVRPEAGAGELEPRGAAAPTNAARSRRLVCWLLDCALVLSPLFLVAGVATLMGRDAPRDREQVAPIIGLTSTAIYALQCAMTATTGQSLAKGWFRIRVTRPNGQPPGFLRGVVLRSWLPALAAGFSVIWPFLAFLTLFDALRIFGSQSRCVHDLLADTIVVDVAERSREARGWSEA
jgi:uncharacterized RDD family membrane protein YckC